MSELFGTQNLRQAQLFAYGREPTWAVIAPVTAVTDPPTTANDGVPLDNAMIAMVGVELQHDHATLQELLLRVTALDTNGAQYRVTLNGTNFDHTTGPNDTLGSIASGLKGLVDADANYTAVMGADAVSVYIKKTDNTAFASHSETVTPASPGEMELDALATSVHFRVWGKPKGRQVWCRMPMADLETAADERTEVERSYLTPMRVSGIDRLYMQIETVNGLCKPLIGPCLNEPTLYSS